MTFGRDKYSGALVRWGRYLDNGVWVAWRYWNNRNMLTRCRVERGYIALSLLTIQWGNQ